MGRQIKKGCGDNNKQRAGGYYVFDEYLKAALY
jgi:hypothetical protein